MDTNQPLNQNGQPKDARLAYSWRAERNIDELIGLTKGIVADGSINTTEAEFLLDWLNTNKDARAEWPANVLYPRLVEMLEDGIIDQEEEHELLKLLMDMGARPKAIPTVQSAASHLPINSPPPLIEFAGMNFCVTGTFLSGKRTQVFGEIESRGGVPQKNVTPKCNYLIIGEIGSRDWIHSTHGRKIERAVELRESGHPIVIATEEHWIKHL